MSLYDLIAEMPKVELHVHLEGSIRPATLLELARRNQMPLPADDLEGIRRFYHFTDFDHFIQVYITISRCLCTVEDFDLIAYEFGADMARQNIRYAEVTFTPYTHAQNTGLSFDDILEGLNAGRARARAQFGVEMAWVLDIVRDCPETRLDVVHWAVSATDRGVVALGLGGTERDHPPEWFGDAFDIAYEAGLHRVPHAGEVAGPESVWGALHRLRAERLGHGVRSIEDPDLVRTLVERQVPLEVSPTSNLCLGVYPTYEAHPIRRLYEAGAVVTVNSDDPPMFNTNLVAEYKALVDHLGFGPDDLERLILNAVNASFLPEDRKLEMARTFRSDLLGLVRRHLAEGGGLGPTSTG